VAVEKEARGGIRCSVIVGFGLVVLCVGLAILLLDQDTALSDPLAYALLLTTLVFIVWFVRRWLTTTPQLAEPQCPKCGTELGRIHRRALDRLVDKYVPVARYRCRNRDCRWHGLRVRRDPI
jgi:hypothetical protein